jgi:hypothetical protein
VGNECAARSYRSALEILAASEIPFLIGGGYGLEFHTGVHRETKDLDVFILPRDCRRLLRHFAGHGHTTRVAEDHWLAKVWIDGALVDLIFGFRNGLAAVDEGWFANAPTGSLLDTPVRYLAVEEMIWSKAFVMERDRYDGADIAHLIRTKEREIDWPRLLAIFGSHWPVLFNHLVMFSFVYPHHGASIPEWVQTEFVRRWQRRMEEAETCDPPLCQGTLLSTTQYVHDILELGFRDARHLPRLPGVETPPKGVPAARSAAASLPQRK